MLPCFKRNARRLFFLYFYLVPIEKEGRLTPLFAPLLVLAITTKNFFYDWIAFNVLLSKVGDCNGV